MHVNRFIRSAQRAHELVLYDFLYLLYESRAARERKGGDRPPKAKKGKERAGGRGGAAELVRRAAEPQPGAAFHCWGYEGGIILKGASRTEGIDPLGSSLPPTWGGTLG